MKLNYKGQMMLTVGLIVGFHLINTVIDHWLISSLGLFLAGLLWIIHPVMVDDEVPTKQQELLLRLTGVALILLGILPCLLSF